MSEIVVYTKNWCGYCRAAKTLLQQLGVDFREIDVTADHDKFREMVRLADGRNTVPQIFVDGTGIGGYMELTRLVHEKKFPPAQ